MLALAVTLLILVIVYCYNLLQGARLKSEAADLVKTAHDAFRDDRARRRSRW